MGKKVLTNLNAESLESARWKGATFTEDVFIKTMLSMRLRYALHDEKAILLRT